MAESHLIGKQGRVTGTIAPRELGEITVNANPGTTKYHALPADNESTYTEGSLVRVVAFSPPMTVYVEGWVRPR